MSSFLISGRPATNQKAFVPVVTEQAFPVLASSITRSFRVGGIVPPEIRNNMLGRFSTMRATNDRDGIYSPEVIKELAAFRILALKHPQAVFNVVHSDSLQPFSGLLFRQKPMRHIDTRARTATIGVRFRILLKSV
jgi:hypothetical protein